MIPTVWSDYIATVCRAFEVSPTSSVVQSQVQICATTTGVQNHLSLHTWAPGEQFPGYSKSGIRNVLFRRRCLHYNTVKIFLSCTTYFAP